MRFVIIEDSEEGTGVLESINLGFKSYRHLELVLANGSFQFSLWLVSHSGEEGAGGDCKSWNRSVHSKNLQVCGGVITVRRT